MGCPAAIDLQLLQEWKTQEVNTGTDGQKDGWTDGQTEPSSLQKLARMQKHPLKRKRIPAVVIEEE